MPAPGAGSRAGEEIAGFFNTSAGVL